MTDFLGVGTGVGITYPSKGDMLKSVYDPGDTGRVTAAGAVSDGVNTVTAAEAKEALESIRYAFLLAG